MTLVVKNPNETVKIKQGDTSLKTITLPTGIWAVVDDNGILVNGKAYKDQLKAQAAALGLELID